MFPAATPREPVDCLLLRQIAGGDAKLLGSYPSVLPTFLPPCRPHGRGWRFFRQTAHECAQVLGSCAPLLARFLASRPGRRRRWKISGHFMLDCGRSSGMRRSRHPRRHPAAPAGEGGLLPARSHVKTGSARPLTRWPMGIQVRTPVKAGPPLSLASHSAAELTCGLWPPDFRH